MLSLCDLVMSADTGTLHLATAVGAKVLALFMGPAQLFETGPYGAGHLVIQARDHCGPCQEQNPVCRGKAPCRRLIPPGAVIRAAQGLLAGDKADKAVAGIGFPPGVKAYAGSLGRFGQSYLPLHPAPLEAEDCLAFGLKQAGLALLYSAYEPCHGLLEEEINRMGAGLLAGQGEKLARWRKVLQDPAGPAAGSGLGFLARLKGPKAPPRAELALRSMAEALDICLSLKPVKNQKSEM